jgi:phytanoyl-CoA hydroxylase
MNWQSDAARVKREYDRDGYVALRGFLSAQQVAELKSEIERYKREVAPKLPATEQFYEAKGQPETLKYLRSLADHDDWFRTLFASEPFVRLAELLLDGPVVGSNLSLFNKPPRVGEATPAHQDGYYFMLEPMEALTMWLALDVVDTENGCVRYVTGSHRRGMRPHQKTQTLGFSQGISDFGTPDDLATEVAMAAQPGDLLVHHCMTIHRADPNRSDRTRHALGFVYYSARARTDAAKHEAYQKSLARELTQTGKI